MHSCMHACMHAAVLLCSGNQSSEFEVEERERQLHHLFPNNMTTETGLGTQPRGLSEFRDTRLPGDAVA